MARPRTPFQPVAPPVATASAEAAEGERLIIDAVATLHANGAESAGSQARVAQMAAALGAHAEVTLGWTQSWVTFGESAQAATSRPFTAVPTTIGMNRVMGVDAALNRLSMGTATPGEAHDVVRTASALPLVNVFLLAAACAVAASGLAVIFGVEHWRTVLLIAVTSAVGAILRRWIGLRGGSNYWQAGAAALVAGLGGALAVQADLSSAQRLAAVCPCMILVPGPHLLNGSLDLAALRIPLGLSRLTFATVTLLAIGAGLLAGLKLGGAALVLDPAGRRIPLWLDAPAAGIVAACFGIFYSAPSRVLVWPFVVGMAGHALHWTALQVWHLEGYVATGLACLLVGAVLVPVSHRFQVPFSAIGFASVVSLIPGLLVIRALDGIVQLVEADADHAQQLLVTVASDASLTLLTLFAMVLGLLVPAKLYEHFRPRVTGEGSSA